MKKTAYFAAIPGMRNPEAAPVCVQEAEKTAAVSNDQISAAQRK
jgi:hypothetical protein